MRLKLYNFSSGFFKVKGIFKALLILLFFSDSLFAQQHDISALEKQLQSANSDTAKWSATRELHNAWFKSDPEKSKYYAQELLTIANRLDSAKLKYKAYSALSRCETKKRNYETALPLDSFALLYATQSGIADDIFSATLTRANQLIDAEQYEKGNDFLIAAETLATKNDNPSQIASVNYSLGIVSAELQQKRKGIFFLNKALNIYLQLNNPRQIAATQTRLAEYHLDLCNTDSAIAFINQALDYYNSVTPKLYNESFAKSILARGYAANGNFKKALENYTSIKEVYLANNNFTDYALTCVDMGGILLNQKSFSKAKALFNEAEKYIKQNNYEPAFPLIEMSWGEYYSFTGDSAKANLHFAKAIKQANKIENVQTKIELKKKLAEHAYRFENKQKGDLLMLEYASEMSEQMEQEELECLLNRIKEKNNYINNEEWNNIKLLYTKGGAAKLKTLLKNKTLSQVIPVDTLLSLNPYSNATPAYDSALNISYNKQLQEIETKYRTSSIKDSLDNTLYQLAAKTKEEELSRQRSIAAIIAVLLFALVVLLLIIYTRRTIKDKKLIESLQGEVDHRVSNSLKVVKRMIDVAEREVDNKVNLDFLKNRVNATILVHESIYKNKLTGKINMQEYLQNLSSALQMTFDPDKKIQLTINAQTSIESIVAERLGLITNELMTNTYKYAFPIAKQNASISIKISTVSNSIKFHYADNGIGLVDEKLSNSFGHTFISKTSQSLKATHRFYNDNGANFEITIPF